MKEKFFLASAGLLLCGILAACQPTVPDPSPVGTEGSTVEVTGETPETTETTGMIETEAPTGTEAVTEPEETTAPPDENNTEMDATPMEEIAYYQNPILTSETADAWPSYGFGDPFVMRYNGKYYLYVSTKDGNVGIKCWSSLDLVNWVYEGYCSDDPITKGAYAPEVYYYNGYFYMYTSPAGNGHYVLRSTSPTEGFEPITGNLGMSIDGSVFIDNDGTWYFYTANHGEMMAYRMTSPSKMAGGRTLNGVTVNGAWTEGPMVVYHDGYYYLTYTGNHVLSKSYRIYYGASERSPVSYAGIAAKNPLLVNTSDEICGIGHSSTVKGPNLDSYYIVYHSLVDLTPNRSTSIDRIVFNGERMEIMGPTVDKQQVPALPDVYHCFDTADAALDGWQVTGSADTKSQGLSLGADSTLVSDHRFDGDYTAEYNILSMAEGTRAGALFSYTDDQNFGACLFDPAAQQVVISMTVNGETTVKTVDMIRSFKEDVSFDCLQSLQIERCGQGYTFYMNDRELCTVENSELRGGAIGYITEGGNADFGFIGGTGAVGGRGVADTYKSVSALNGLIPADSYTLGAFETVQKDGITLVVAREGDILNYRVLASSDGAYDLVVRYATEDGGLDATLEVYVDGVAVTTVPLTASSTVITAVCRDIPMSEGQHTVSFKLFEGNADLLDFTLLKSVAVTELALNYNNFVDGHVYSDGSWSMTESLKQTKSDGSGKRLYGDKNWGDYTVEVSVTPLNALNCGLLVRATNPGTPAFMGLPPSAEQTHTGTDWVEGYFVGLTENAVILGKQSYSYTELTRADGHFETGKTYRLKVVCLGARLQVYVDGELCIDYTDADPYIQGMVGVRCCGCSAAFDDLNVTNKEGTV